MNGYGINQFLTLGGAMTPTTLGQWLHPHLSRAYQRWGKQEAGVRRGDDPEAIHQMRVALRRIRAAMTGFEAVLDLPRVTRKVGMISRVLGQARDGDVMLARLEQDYLPGLPPAEQAVLRDFIRGLRRQRQDVQREVVALLNSATYQRVKEAWGKWLDHPRWQSLGDCPVAETVPHLLAIAWGELALHPGWRVTTPEADPELLHDLRKAIKRTRYLWEFADNSLAMGLSEPLGLLREAQEVLGHLQDGFVLASQMGNACPTLQERLTREREEHWQTWQNLRRQLQSRAIQQQVYHTLGDLGLNGADQVPPKDEIAHPAVIPLG